LSFWQICSYAINDEEEEEEDEDTGEKSGIL